MLAWPDRASEIGLSGIALPVIISAFCRLRREGKIDDTQYRQLKSLLLADPAFGGTRDQRLVEIMKKRVGTFSLLLGGVHDFDVDETSAADEKWRSEVVQIAKKQLRAEGGRLRAKELGTEI